MILPHQSQPSGHDPAASSHAFGIGVGKFCWVLIGPLDDDTPGDLVQTSILDRSVGLKVVVDLLGDVEPEGS